MIYRCRKCGRKWTQKQHAKNCHKAKVDSVKEDMFGRIKRGSEDWRGKLFAHPEHG